MYRTHYKKHYKRFLKNRQAHIERLRKKQKNTRRKRTRNRYATILRTHKSKTPKGNTTIELVVPRVFCFEKNVLECSAFLSELRSIKGNHDTSQAVFIDFNKVEEVDFAAVMTFSSICDMQTKQHVQIRGNMPSNQKCLKFMLDSGFLEDKFNMKGHKFSVVSKAESVTIETGRGKLIATDLINLANLSQHISLHLTDRPLVNSRFTSMVKEICGNTIEWSSTNDPQWRIAAKYEDDYVSIVAHDLGKGILRTLVRKFPAIFKDTITLKGDNDILAGAFNKKYGSTTLEPNRNKGLPCVKAAFEDGVIKDLYVITNNVLLHYSDKLSSQIIAPHKTSPKAFKGTLYTFKIDKQCLSNIIGNEN